MLTICWAAKGGSGTSVTVASIVFASTQPCVLVDLDGDQPTIMGIGDIDTPGVHDWLSSDAAPDRLGALELPLSPGKALIPRGSLASPSPARWATAADHWATDLRHVIVDAGTAPPAALLEVAPNIDSTARRLLVTRACYLSVRAAAGSGLPIDGVVLVDEPGRSLRAGDVARALGAPVVANVLVDPAVARAVDAGLLAGRIPQSVCRQLRDVAA